MDYEILAPAGSQQALDAAFAAGADAVYFGLPLFGARAFAKNFTLEEAGRQIEAAHAAGRKIYVTMNTLVEEDQMEQAYEYAKALHEMGVDALILQDLGLIHLLHHRLPDLELHASTQLSVSRPEQIEKLKQLGIQRVVLAREATLDEIRACAATGMELEAFVHGALCISYSGQCQFSRIRYGRSGNKGACAQPCRMEYTLLENGKPVETEGNFLLSPKDLSLISRADELIDAGVYSLKIEGRMKSPEYVYESVHALDKTLHHQKLDGEDVKKLKTAFNRGYTEGHAFEKTGSDLMNSKTSNHQGIQIGKVLSVSRDRVRVQLSENLAQNDGIRFVGQRGSVGQIANFIYDSKGKLVSSAKAGETVEIKISQRIPMHAAVFRTSSYELTKEVEQAVRQNRPQADIFLKLSAEDYGQPVILEADDGIHTVQVQGSPLQQAKKTPSAPDQIIHQLSKTGNTWAHVDRVDLDLPDAPFLANRELNDLRRSVLERLETLRKTPQPIRELEYSFQPDKPELAGSFVEISRKEQAADDGLLQISEFPIAGTRKKANLHQAEGFMCDHLGNGRIVENMNITNSYALAAVLEMGYQGAVISSETSEEGLKQMLDIFKERYGFDAPAIWTVYEKPRLMLMKHCPVNTVLKDGTRKNCSLCRTNRYELLGKDGRKAALQGNSECMMQLFDESADDQISRIQEFRALGIPAFRMILTDEDAQESRKLRGRFKQELEK